MKIIVVSLLPKVKRSTEIYLNGKKERTKCQFMVYNVIK